MTRSDKQKLTPAELARLWGVSQSTVRAWITSGELRAINASRDRTSERPRLLIDRDDIAAFERTRELPAAETRRRSVRRSKLRDLTKYV